MAVRKFILNIGQSNASPVAESQTWEDTVPTWAIRNPARTLAQVPQFAEGTYRDSMTMPGTWEGGPMGGRLGDVSFGESWSNVNLRGKAISALRYLTFYNPVASYMNSLTGWTQSYPNTFSIADGSTTTKLICSVKWQTNPTNLVVTRQRTGTTHTVNSAGALNELQFDDPMVPPPQAGEQFSFEHRAAADSASGTVVQLEQLLGGLNDEGSERDTSPIVATLFGAPLAGFHTAELRQVLSGGVSKTVSAWDDGTETITSAGHGMADGTEVKFISGTTPAAFTRFTSYYVISSATNTFQLSATSGGAAVAFSAGGAAGVVLQTVVRTGGVLVCRTRPIFPGQPVGFAAYAASALPTGLSVGNIATGLAPGDTYYVTRRGVEDQVLSGFWDHGNNALNFPSHGLVNNERVEISGLLADGYTENTPYYVIVKSQDTFQLAKSPGGTVTAFGSNPGAVTLTRREGWAHYNICTGTAPFGADIVFDKDGAGTLLTVQIQAQFRGCLSGMMLRCTSGAAAGESVAIEKVVYTSSISKVHVKAPGFSTAPSAGHRFVIEPPDVDGVATPFHKWAYWLPWSPFEGKANNGAPLNPATFVGFLTPGTDVAVSPVAATIGGQFRFFTTGKLPPPLKPGKRYYVQEYGGTTCHFTETYGSSTRIVSLGGTFTIDEAASESAGTPVLNCTAHGFKNGDAVQVSGADLGEDLAASTTYYVINRTANTLQLSATEGGNGVPFDSNGDFIYDIGSGTQTIFGVGVGSHYVQIIEQEGRTNPFPPGFNYANHIEIPYLYQPFDGGSLAPRAKIAAHTIVGLNLHEQLGETIYIASMAIGSTSIGYRAASASPTGGSQAFGWWDDKQLLSWSPGEPNGCYARTLDVLDTAKAAADQAGDTLECIGVLYAQGEGDANSQYASRYLQNLTTLKTKIREAIKSRGMRAGSAATIPWIQPQITTVYWTEAATVNAAISTACTLDPYHRTCEVSDLTLMPDGVHYDGLGMKTLADRMTTELLAVMENWAAVEVSICNLALANLGEAGAVTSIDPVDGSTQSALCAQYYAIARDSLLEAYRWSWATKSIALVQRATNERTEWLYAYDLPPFLTGVISVLPPDSTDDQMTTAGTRLGVDYAIESNSSGLNVLYTNVDDAVVRYSAKIVDATKYPELFKLALAWNLSGMLAGPLIKGDVGAAAAKQALQMATLYTEKAKAQDGNTKRQKQVTHTPSWIGGR